MTPEEIAALRAAARVCIERGLDPVGTAAALFACGWTRASIDYLVPLLSPERVIGLLDEREALREIAQHVTRSDVVLAASRGVYSAAVTHPTAHLGDAAREFGYQARTATGDAFEAAHEWARGNEQARRDMGDGARTAIEAERDSLRRERDEARALATRREALLDEAMTSLHLAAAARDEARAEVERLKAETRPRPLTPCARPWVDPMHGVASGERFEVDDPHSGGGGA